MKRWVRGSWFRPASADGDLGTGWGGVDAENLSSGLFRGEHNNSLSAWVRTLARQQVRCGTGRHCSLSPTSWTGHGGQGWCAWGGRAGMRLCGGAGGITAVFRGARATPTAWDRERAAVTAQALRS